MRGTVWALLAMMALASGASAQGLGPQGGEIGAHREQIWRILSADPDRPMLTTVFRPPGEQRRPLAVINHGSPVSGRSQMQRQRFAVASSWLVRQGYVVVLPLRRGYGETGGRWNESYGSCEVGAYYGAGVEAAKDVDAAVQYMRTQPFVLPDRTLIVGQSAGGWATVAYSARNPAGVPVMVNFAGGRGGRHQNIANNNCAPRNLVDAAGRFGRTARVPTLWIYTQNDSFFDPELSRRMADAYKAGGGNADYRLLPAFGRDGHSLFGSTDGVAVWSPLVQNFIAPHR
ncbi:MAG: prolyl oligopeptidase family serine peptidase [Alphaproteobacteria bacterium]|nr:prolyl oligopeptidase family serine peptidase [Alphaproteobacteria bacterium]MCW5741695.1 prolyl oligopeptidase family serine peptidase [Alphaproteobacteria bacterium]